jgi:hypothetical protein
VRINMNRVWSSMWGNTFLPRPWAKAGFFYPGLNAPLDLTVKDIDNLVTLPSCSTDPAAPFYPFTPISPPPPLDTTHPYPSCLLTRTNMSMLASSPRLEQQ